MVVVLHYEAYQGQVRDLQLETQSAVPARVESCRGCKSAVRHNIVYSSRAVVEELYRRIITALGPGRGI